MPVINTDSFSVSETFPVSASVIYNAWLDSWAHSKFTGGAAKINPVSGGDFTAWDGYISGKNMELQPFTRIVQSWHATDFPDGAAESLIEVMFSENNGETVVTINHSNIPEGMGNGYKQGWHDYYFKPMKEYFK